MNAAHSAANQALLAGLSTVPPRMDGSKRPIGPWEKYQRMKPPGRLVDQWYSNGQTGVGLITGAVSGNLECLDFDTREVWADCKQAAQGAGLWDLLKRVANGYAEQSPNGFHLLYKCDQIEGSKKLAQRSSDKKTLIETRGEGAFIIVAPSSGGVNPAGDYVLKAGGFASIATITSEERTQLHTLAMTFDEMPKPAPERPKGKAGGDRPGDRYNAITTWTQLLGDAGWAMIEEKGEAIHWRRPGKDEGISATTNHAGSDCLWVFSTSTEFEAGRSYTKFGAYAQMRHGGDFAAATRALGGTNAPSYSEAPPPDYEAQYLPGNDRGPTDADNSLTKRYIFVTDQNRFFDTKTGGLLELQAVGNAWSHVHKKPKAHTLILADGACQKADTIAYWPGIDERLVEYGGSIAVNTWRPSTLELPKHATDEDVVPWLELVDYLVPIKKDQSHLIDWMAAILQQPERKINHALLLAGKERIGKDTIIQPLIYGLGTWNVNQPLAEELLEPYTDYLHNAKLVIFQEIQNFEKLSIQNKLKPMLASPPDTLRVRLFQRGFYETPNIVQCLFMSNHKDALKISERDPRYFAVWCDQQRLADSYYEELYRWLHDGGIAKVVRWLLDRDITKFNFAGPAPDTEFKSEIRRLGRSALEMELQELIEGVVFPFDLDFIRPRDVLKRLHNCNLKSLARALDELGHVRREERIRRAGGGRQQHTIWIIRNHEFHTKNSFSAMIDQWESHIE